VVVTGGNTRMHAREEVKIRIIATKLKRWHAIAHYPLIDIRCPTWRARKNFQKLVRRYPEIAARLGFDELSVYPPI